jgi:hypothetical protein
MPGGVTPCCNDCGIALCWDISEDQYHEEKSFWDDWICQDCNGGERMSLRDYRIRHGLPVED